MMFAGFTTKTLKRFAPLTTILALGVYLRLLKIGKLFPFDHDQEFVANSAFSFFVDSRVTLIGQELSFPGFFLGPIHNWILFLPYGICNLSPKCVPYFFISIGTVTIILLYLVAQKIFDSKIATIASAIYATSFVAISSEIGASSNFFLFISQLALLFTLYKYFQGKDQFLPAGAFIAGLAVVNFNPVFIFSAIAFFMTALFREKREILIYLLSACAYLLNYLPLAVFNFRHQNILWSNFKNFSSQNADPLVFFDRLKYLAADVVLPYWANFSFKSTSLIFTIPTLFILGISIYLIIKKKNGLLTILPIWLAVPLIGFSFYGGNIPDYYFLQTLLAVILLISITLAKNLLLFIIFSSVFTFANLKSLVNYDSGINYQVKDQVVNFIINDSRQDSYNVYYDFPPGLNTGYDYLFKISQNQPREGGKNLYILELRDHTDILRYRNSFLNKNVEVKTIGFVNIVSVK